MVLTLEVVGPEGDELGLARRKVFDTAGGTIGRLKSNTWTLAEGHVSGRHAVIRFRNGQFLIEDTSTNGTCLNSPNNKLEKGRQYPLSSNDLILIDPFEIRVTIQEEARNTPAGRPAPAPEPGPLLDPPLLDPVSEMVDPMAALGFGPSPKPGAAPQRQKPVDMGNRPPQGEAFVPPRVVSPASEPEPQSGDTEEGEDIPEWDFINDRPIVRPAKASTPPATAHSGEARPVGPYPRPTPGPRARHAAAPPPPAVPAAAAPPPAPAPAPAAEPSLAGLAEVLRGAGVDPSLVTPELARDLGRILRIVVSGVLDVLEVRKRIKEEFRLGVTTIRPQDNNPLKMSADVDDALHNLLVKRSAAYMAPVEAFEDAFGDIRGHQLAMLEGMRAAFNRMMERFEPQRLQEEFEQHGRKGSLLSGSAKSHYWDLYCEKIRDMVRDSEASFRELFGDEFADAYEEHLKRHKARGRGGDQ
jgi:type VI secretion system FHA domain protein